MRSEGGEALVVSEGCRQRLYMGRWTMGGDWLSQSWSVRGFHSPVSLSPVTRPPITGHSPCHRLTT